MFEGWMQNIKTSIMSMTIMSMTIKNLINTEVWFVFFSRTVKIDVFDWDRDGRYSISSQCLISQLNWLSFWQKKWIFFRKHLALCGNTFPVFQGELGMSNLLYQIYLTFLSRSLVMISSGSSLPVTESCLEVRASLTCMRWEGSNHSTTYKQFLLISTIL